MKSTSKKSKADKSKPVSMAKALSIAKQHCKRKSSDFRIYNKLPDSWFFYNLPKEPCWYVYVPDDPDDELMLKPGRALLISMTTGKVLFDGSAGDEG